MVQTNLILRPARVSSALVAVFALVSALLMACRASTPDDSTLTFGAYTTPREVYGKAIVPTFIAAYSQQTGRPFAVEESYLGSGARARAIVEGFEADIAALSLEPDIAILEKAGLITRDWKARGNHGGMVTRSIVVIGVREGNPHGIADWADLAQPGIEVLTPNVRTSGGAMWNVAAIYGAALRGQVGRKRSPTTCGATMPNAASPSTGSARS